MSEFDAEEELKDKEKPVETTYYSIYGTLKNMPLNTLCDPNLNDKNVLKVAKKLLHNTPFTPTRYEKRKDSYDYTSVKQEIDSHFLYKQHTKIDLVRVSDKIAMCISPMARDENDKTFSFCFADLEIAEEMFSKMIIVVQKMKAEKVKFNNHMKETLKQEQINGKEESSKEENSKEESKESSKEN